MLYITYIRVNTRWKYMQKLYYTLNVILLPHNIGHRVTVLLATAQTARYTRNLSIQLMSALDYSFVVLHTSHLLLCVN